MNRVIDTTKKIAKDQIFSSCLRKCKQINVIPKGLIIKNPLASTSHMSVCYV